MGCNWIDRIIGRLKTAFVSHIYHPIRGGEYRVTRQWHFCLNDLRYLLGLPYKNIPYDIITSKDLDKLKSALNAEKYKGFDTTCLTNQQGG